jgi:hypothetical protein
MNPLLYLFAGPVLGLAAFALVGGGALPGAMAAAVVGQLVSYPLVRGLMRRRMLEFLRRLRAERGAVATGIAGHIKVTLVVRSRPLLGERVVHYCFHTLLTLALASAFWFVFL